MTSTKTKVRNEKKNVYSPKLKISKYLPICVLVNIFSLAYIHISDCICRSNHVSDFTVRQYIWRYVTVWSDISLWLIVMKLCWGCERMGEAQCARIHIYVQREKDNANAGWNSEEETRVTTRTTARTRAWGNEIWSVISHYWLTSRDIESIVPSILVKALTSRAGHGTRTNVQ